MSKRYSKTIFESLLCISNYKHTCRRQFPVTFRNPFPINHKFICYFHVCTITLQSLFLFSVCRHAHEDLWPGFLPGHRAWNERTPQVRSHCLGKYNIKKTHTKTNTSKQNKHKQTQSQTQAKTKATIAHNETSSMTYALHWRPTLSLLLLKRTLRCCQTCD